MNEKLLERCDLLVKNRAAIHKSFFLENELMAVAAALVFTDEGREADIEKMKSARKLLNKNTRLLSNLRDIIELVILSKMALANDPEKYLEDFLSVYNKMIKGKFLENDYMALASVTILDYGLEDECDEIIERANEITKRMNKDHPILTSVDDTSFIVFLAITRKNVDQILADLTEGYDYIKSAKTGINADPTYELCEVLAVSYGDMTSKCDKIIKIYKALEKQGSDYTSGYVVSALGSLIDSEMDPEKLANEIVESEVYLKDQKGFGNTSMDRSTRVMYAVLLTAGVYGSGREAGNSIISNTLSIVWAKKIAKMVSMLVQVAPSVASAVIKTGDSGSSSETTGSTSETQSKQDERRKKQVIQGL